MDKEEIEFMIFGICQGVEVLSYLANNDAKDTLSNVVLYRKSTTLKWEVEKPAEDSRLFAGFR